MLKPPEFPRVGVPETWNPKTLTLENICDARCNCPQHIHCCSRKKGHAGPKHQCINPAGLLYCEWEME